MRDTTNSDASAVAASTTRPADSRPSSAAQVACDAQAGGAQPTSSRAKPTRNASNCSGVAALSRSGRSARKPTTRPAANTTFAAVASSCTRPAGAIRISPSASAAPRATGSAYSAISASAAAG